MTMADSCVLFVGNSLHGEQVLSFKQLDVGRLYMHFV